MWCLLWKLLETIFKRKPRCNHSKILSWEEIEINFKIFFLCSLEESGETWVKCVMCNMHLRLDLSCVTTSASLMYVTELIVVKCLTENNHKFRAWLLFIVHGYHTKNWRSYNGKNPPDIQRGFLFDSWINYAPIYKKIQQYKTNYDSFFLQQTGCTL